jgi:hypothetical protein
MYALITYKLPDTLPVSKKRNDLANKPYYENTCNRRPYSVVTEEAHDYRFLCCKGEEGTDAKEVARVVTRCI